LPDFSEFIPIFQETPDRIRARMFADVNAGLDPNDPDFLDTTPGGLVWDLVSADVLEIERLWDAVGSEMIAAMLPAYAWGTYLDEHAATVGLTRKPAVPSAGTVTFTGTAGTLIASGTQVATVQTDPESEPVIFATTAPGTIPGGGSIALAVEAVIAGTAGNVVAGAVSVLLSPLDGIASLTNADPTLGGADVETDEALRRRILLVYTGSQGSGTRSDYLSWALAYPGVGFATVEPLWNGDGTVRVVVTDAANRPVSGTIVSGLQAQLDPVAGEGLGLAPIGAHVTVATPTTVTVDVFARVSPYLEVGYVLDGPGGIAVRADLEEAVSRYIDTLPPGEGVVLTHVSARFFEVAGVNDLDGLLLNGFAQNVGIGPLQVAVTGTVDLA
jgi:uncharacterized phage protein gp47/JayE